MRVALMPSAFWPAMGGVEELTRRLADCLAEAGDDVEVWAPTDSDGLVPRQETWEGLVVRRFPMALPPARFPDGPLTLPTMLTGLRQLRCAAREFRPALLHVQCFGPNGAYATAVSMATGTPLVVSLQGETVMDDHDIYERSTVLRSALRVAFRRAAAITGCSLFAIEDAQRFGLRPGQGRVVFNGVRLDEPGTAPERQGASRPASLPFDRYVFALGRVVEKKGFDLLLRAFARVPGHGDIGLVIGGDGAALRSLRELASTLGIADRAHFAGRLGRPDVARLMRGAEVFVMPSRIEPFGIVVLEAWREGTPVVATTHGGPPEFVHDGVDGVLVDPLDITSLAAAIQSLLDDEERRAELARKGLEAVHSFAWPAITGQYRRIYAEVAHRGRE